MMQELGFEVDEAGHGREALQRLSIRPTPDVMLVDWNMPEMNGLELLQALRAEPQYAEIPVVMVTTEAELERITAALEAGANEYVMKPFDREAILGKLEMIGVLQPHAEA